MATTNIRAVITAEDRASKVVSQFGDNVGKASKKVTQSNNNVKTSFNEILASTVIMGSASKKLLGVIDDSVMAANKYQGALLGLSSIAKAFGVNATKAKEAAEDLAKDGLLTVADSARGLKNLLQSGFSLPQAVKLMERFKDSAAFGKQAALSFGDAVASATEGIKNGNSILVDNAGITKNLSIILKEAGFSEQDLMRATSDATVRQALYNGIIKETNAQVGDAAKLSETYAGGQARLSAQTTILKQQLGEALQPALVKILETVTPLIEKFARFTEQHPKLVSAVLLVTTAVTGLIAAFGALGLAIMGLKPIFAGFAVTSKASIVAVGAAYKGLAALVAIPMVMPAIIVGAAILALKWVYDQAKKTREMVEGAIRAHEKAANIGSIVNQSKAFGGQSTKGLSVLGGGGLSQTNFGGNLALGGPVTAGRAYMVGERNRPEMFVPNQNGRIINDKDLKQMGGSPVTKTQQTFNITVQAGAFMGTKQDARQYAKMIMEAYQDLMSMKMRTA